MYRWIKKAETLGQSAQVENPSDQLTRITREWRTIWEGSTSARFSADAEAWPEEPIASEAIEKACRTFPQHTAVGVDRLRPRHLPMLPALALEMLAVIVNMSEAAGVPLVEGADIVFLPKPTGGERPIGILPTLYRVWCRCRRPAAHLWEEENSRDYFWAAAGRSSSQAVHLQGVRLEAARADGQTAAALLTDLAKAYEYVNHSKLVQFAKAKKFPTRLLRLCIATYGGMRRVVSHGQCSTWFEVPGQTIVAGCGMATTLLKVYTIELFDALRKWHPRVELHVYVDDVDLFCAQRRAADAADALTGAARLLLQVFERALCLQVAFQKCVLLATSADVGVRLQKGLASTGLSIKPWGEETWLPVHVA